MDYILDKWLLYIFNSGSYLLYTNETTKDKIEYDLLGFVSPIYVRDYGKIQSISYIDRKESSSPMINNNMTPTSLQQY